MFRILAFLLLPVICLAQVNSKVEKPTGELLSNEISPNDMKRNASFNLDEIKVRWKKAALENCTGGPCVSITPPGPVTNIVATVTSPTSASVAFAKPASDGGSPITGYEVTATPTTPSAPAKRKSSATIIAKGDKSPIIVEGLTTGVSYNFSVLALNAAGGSTPTVTVTPVTPCNPNTGEIQQDLQLPRNANISGVIGSTSGATGIGAVSGIPEGLSVSWSNNSILIKGETRSQEGPYEFTITLTGGCGNVIIKGLIYIIDPL